MGLHSDHLSSPAEQRLLTAISLNSDGASSSSNWDDKELFIRKVFEEDPKKGCEILFRKYYQPLCSYTIRYVYSKEMAQDIVSEIFYSLWKNELYRNMTSSYRAYLYVASRNRSLKYLQREFGKNHVERLTEAEPDYISALPSPLQILQYEELNQKVERVIHAMPPQNQKVFLMSRFEGKKYATIAEELSLSTKTVEAHMSKALALLRKALRNELLIGLLALFSY